jgi:hypothetical protein
MVHGFRLARWNNCSLAVLKPAFTTRIRNGLSCLKHDYKLSFRFFVTNTGSSCLYKKTMINLLTETALSL